MNFEGDTIQLIKIHIYPLLSCSSTVYNTGDILPEMHFCLALFFSPNHFLNPTSDVLLS